MAYRPYIALILDVMADKARITSTDTAQNSGYQPKHGRYNNVTSH